MKNLRHHDRKLATIKWIGIYILSMIISIIIIYSFFSTSEKQRQIEYENITFLENRLQNLISNISLLTSNLEKSEHLMLEVDRLDKEMFEITSKPMGIFDQSNLRISNINAGIRDYNSEIELLLKTPDRVSDTLIQELYKQVSKYQNQLLAFKESIRSYNIQNRENQKLILLTKQNEDLQNKINQQDIRLQQKETADVFKLKLTKCEQDLSSLEKNIEGCDYFKTKINAYGTQVSSQSQRLAQLSRKVIQLKDQLNTKVLGLNKVLVSLRRKHINDLVRDVSKLDPVHNELISISNNLNEVNR